MASFEAADSSDLRLVGVSSLLDLALLLPVGFEDFSCTDEPRVGQMCNVAVNIQSQHTAARTLQITAFAPLWNAYIKIAIFNASRWHYGAFKSGKELILHGKLGEYGGFLSLQNPKILKELSGIKAYFKLGLKDERILELKAKYLNAKNLALCGLNDNEINTLLALNANDKNAKELLDNLPNNKEVLNILKFTEIYNHIRKLSSKKTIFSAQKISPNDISQWLKSLPFVPTGDQLKAIDDIKNDLKSDQAKRRVIMGDVGSGKSLVMFATALLAAPKKSIIMAPTSILAQQLYTEAKRLLPSDFSILLVQSGDKKVDFSNATLIIGTHVLLYQKLPKCAVIMIDEQHRFGSAQRHKIELLSSQGEDEKESLAKNSRIPKQKGEQEGAQNDKQNDEQILSQNHSANARAHFLQFSATPIPRTLALINSRFVSYSFLKQMPFKKQILTKIIKNADFNALLEHIRTQIEQGKQTIIVYPLVASNERSNYTSLEEAKSFWFSRFEGVYATHGKDKEKENIVANFAQNGNILLSTTIIEVGISLPRLSTIVVVGAERLGLASLHQLRGRVGRHGGQGWCFLFTKMSTPPQRLIDFCATLDGFEVANIDYKNRQGGDILDGSIQHGATFRFYELEEDITTAAQARAQV